MSLPLRVTSTIKLPVVLGFHWLSLSVLGFHWLSLSVLDFHWVSLSVGLNPGNGAPTTVELVDRHPKYLRRAGAE